MAVRGEGNGDALSPAILFGLILPLATALRLPLLARATSYFTSDEAIVGLIARHFSSGEYPAFFWGQGYMGTIESYLAKALFWVGGESVAVLKMASLVFFLLFLVAHYDLAALLTTRRRALLSTAILAVGPSALLSWSVRAMAGYMETLFFGTVFLAALIRVQRSGRPSQLVIAGLSAGLGWWTSQLVACYLLAGAVLVLRLPFAQMRGELRATIREWFWLRSTVVSIPAIIRCLLIAMNVIAAGYFLIGAFVLLTGGGEMRLGHALIRATDGWRLVRYAMEWITIEAILLAVVTFRSRCFSAIQRAAPFIAGAAIGILPILLHPIHALAAGAPAHRFSLPDLLAQVPLFFDRMLPVLVGGSDAEGETIGWPLTLLLLGTLALLLLAMRRDAVPRPALYLGLATAGLFLFSGNFQDFASYRYLIPLYPALSLMVAGATRIRKRTVPSFALVALLWLHGDFAQSNALEPDTASAGILTWFRERHVDCVWADYWIAYRLDFIGGERPIFAPYHSQDRYPAYTDRARAASEAGYVFRVGDPGWPAFVRARGRRIIESKIVGRYRLYRVDQKKWAATSPEAAAQVDSGYEFSPALPR